MTPARHASERGQSPPLHSAFSPIRAPMVVTARIRKPATTARNTRSHRRISLDYRPLTGRGEGLRDHFSARLTPLRGSDSQWRLDVKPLASASVEPDRRTIGARDLADKTDIRHSRPHDEEHRSDNLEDAEDALALRCERQ